MRKLMAMIVTTLVLGAVVPSCSDAPRYDSRLTTADSLMRNNPDSALAIIEAVNRDSLTTEHDRAYRDLLLTQARYKAYIPAISDSDINRALSYYKQHPKEREKLTRAYLYKGAVMEELGHSDTALLSFKTAEAIADNDDYINLGQINVRIGALYRNHYTDFQTCYEKYEKALNCFLKVGNKPMQLVCLYNMGMCSGITHNGNPITQLDRALAIAVELNDSSMMYKCQELSCRILLLEDSTRKKAKQIGLTCLKEYCNYINNDLIVDLAKIYLVEERLDSAKYFVGLMEKESDFRKRAQQEVNRLRILADIAYNEGNILNSKSYADSSRAIVDSIENDKKKYQIQKIENTKTRSIIHKITKKTKNLELWMIILVGVLIVLLPVAAYSGISYAIRLQRFKQSIKEIERLKHENVDYREKHGVLIDVKNSVIDNFINNMLSFMQTAFNSCEQDSPIVLKKKIKESIISMETEEFWNELRRFLDTHHKNIIANIIRNPKITEQELRLIELSCCGFDYLEIAIALEYSPNYISKKRDIIAKKLGIKIPLQDYLDKLMSK